MAWSSDGRWIAFYAIVATFFMYSWAVVPA
jgi:hypothetical protein